MTQRIQTEQVELIYAAEVNVATLRSRDLLEAAVNAPFQAGFGQEFYPTLVQKTAKLIEGISRAQAYVDGNKRLAWLTGVSFARVNGLELRAGQVESAEFVLGLEGSREGLLAGALWLDERLHLISNLRQPPQPD